MKSVTSRREAVLGATALLSALPFGGARAAAAWPTKLVRFICAYPAGGLTDQYARAYGDYIQQKFGQPVVVENKTGGGGAVAAIALKSAPADSHTLMVTISATLLGNRVLNKSLPYDPDKDFSFISLMSAGHLPLLVHKSTGATNIKEFVEYARKNKVSFGSYAAGSFAHIVCVELNKLYGLDMVVVNYRGEAPMWQDMHAGAIQAAVGSYQAALSVIDAGTGRPIAVQTTKRMRKLPDVPTFIEQGLPPRAFQLKSWICMVGQAGMPKETIGTISDIMVEAGKSERIQKILDTFGVDDAAVGPAEFQAIYAAEGPIWIDLVSKLKIAPE
jgi:tripartite-type tricarboxylate transporter receptor subunit TctC